MSVRPFEEETVPVPEMPETRRRMASAFDSLVESNLKLVGSVDGLVTSMRRQMAFQAVVLVVVVILFAIAMWRH